MVTMDEEALNLHMQNLEEFVVDEAKTVTYKWLSRELNLHVNVAKELLLTFWKLHPARVKATYFLSGLLEDEVTHKVLIVQEQDLEKAKLRFKFLASEHVYSVQKSTEMADLHTLYIIDRYNRDDSETRRLNAVCCNDAVERAADEIARLKNTVCCNDAVERAADEIASLKIKVRASTASTDIRAWPGLTKKMTTEDSKENGTAASTSEEKVPTKKEEKKEIKSGGIAALFAAQSMKPSKQENVIKKGDTIEKSKAAGKAAPNSRSCFVTFFNRNAEKPKEKSKPSVSVVAKDENKPEEVVSDENKASESEGSSEWRTKSEPVRKEKKVDSVKPTIQQKNKRKASDDPSSSKRRKRIIYLSDSENSDCDIFGSDEEEGEDPISLHIPEPAPVPMVESDEVIEPTTKDEKKHGRKRERKLKVSTFMDDEGYVVTKREYVVESCTDSEGEEQTKKMKLEEKSSDKVKDEESPSTSEPPAKKKCSSLKLKQSTLTNLFKKK